MCHGNLEHSYQLKEAQLALFSNVLEPTRLAELVYKERKNGEWLYRMPVQATSVMSDMGCKDASRKDYHSSTVRPPMGRRACVGILVNHPPLHPPPPPLLPLHHFVPVLSLPSQVRKERKKSKNLVPRSG